MLVAAGERCAAIAAEMAASQQSLSA